MASDPIDIPDLLKGTVSTATPAADPKGAGDRIDPSQGRPRTRLKAYLDHVDLMNAPPGILVQGWTCAERMAGASARSGVALDDLPLQWMLRFPRQDVADFLGRGATDDQGLGFIAFFSLSTGQSADDILIRFEDEDGPFEASGPISPTLTELARDKLCSVWPWLAEQVEQVFGGPAPEPWAQWLGPGLQPASEPPAEPGERETPETLAAETSKPRLLQGHLDQVNLLDWPRGVFVQGWTRASRIPGATLSSAAGTRQVALEWCLRFPRPDVSAYLGEPGESSFRFGFLAFYPLAEGERPEQLGLGFDDLDEPFWAGAAVTPTVTELARGNLRSMWPRLVPELFAAFPEAPPLALMNLAATRVEDLEDALGLHIDHFCDLGEGHFFIDGWCRPIRETVRLFLSDERHRSLVPLDRVWSRTDRQDPKAPTPGKPTPGMGDGFVAYVDFGKADANWPRNGTRPWFSLYALLGDGRIGRLAAQASTPGRLTDAAQILLGAFRHRQPEALDIIDRHIGPALDRALRTLTAPAAVRLRRDFGTARSSPKCSVLVHLLDTTMPWHAQLARLALDETFWSLAQLVYLVDDPALADAAPREASSLYDRHARPFRLVTLSQTVGRARALDLGVAESAAPYVAFLDYEVLPDQAGWLERLIGHLDARRERGAVAPLLINIDGSVRNAGLAVEPDFEHPELETVCALAAPHRVSAPGAGVGTAAVPVEAASMACLVTRRIWLERLGPLAGPFLGGYGEDYLFCRRLAAAGAGTSIAPDTRLFHLGGYARRLLEDRDARREDPERIANARLYNLWRHRLERVAARIGA